MSDTSVNTSVRIGALHADAWTGLVLSDRPGAGFGLRFAVERARAPGSGETLDLDDFFWLTHDVGPHDPEGRYARVAFDLALPLPGSGDAATDGSGGSAAAPPVVPRVGRAPGLTLEWARVGDRAVVGRARADFEGALLFRGWFPWDWAGEWQALGEGMLAAESADGGSALAAWVMGARAGVAPTPGAGDPRAGVTVRIPVSPGDDAVFAAAIASDLPGAAEVVEAIDPAAVPAGLADAAAAYEARRTRVTGELEGLAAAVTDTIHWTVLLQPETGRTYTPAGRRWVFPRAEERGGGRDHWTVFGWDSYFNALELAVEAPAAARETLLAGLRTAYPNGCVPNWRGRFGGTPDRSQPPIGSLAALKLHLRRPDPAMLETAYPLLRAWSDWWVAEREAQGADGAAAAAGGAAGAAGAAPRRAPGPRGLLTWGSDPDRIDPLAPPWERDAGIRQLAAWESGQDDLPTWDEAEESPAHHCLAVDPVDLNAYRVLDLECLAKIAWELGLDDEGAAHHAAAADLRRRINEHLWDADRETYADRRWDGSFTPARTASHFLVLAAGVAPDDRARRMVEHLTDPALFWGDFMVPTLSRDDPRFAEQQYWRGTIWPPINYLVHLGLARYGFDAEAAAVAERGARMFLEDRRRTGLCRENFDSRTGEGGGQRHQSWGPLFALTALEELVDITPWDGLRVGGLRPDGRAELTNLDLGPRGLFDLAVGPEGLALRVDGRPVLQTDAPAVLRGLDVGADRVAMEVACETELTLRAHLAGSRFRAEVGGHAHERSAPVARVPAGRTRVAMRALD
jgi:hypothetical protein